MALAEDLNTLYILATDELSVCIAHLNTTDKEPTSKDLTKPARAGAQPVFIPDYP